MGFTDPCSSSAEGGERIEKPHHHQTLCCRQCAGTRVGGTSTAKVNRLFQLRGCMPSIIGAVHVIKYKRGKAPKSKARGEYKDRNEMLPLIGYASYVEYLKSDDWFKIRDKVIRKHPECSCCDKPASQVHHHNYDARVMLGLVTDLLFPLCDECHTKIEVLPDGGKRELRHVQEMLAPMLKPHMQQRLACGLGRIHSQNVRAKHARKNRMRKQQKRNK